MTVKNTKTKPTRRSRAAGSKPTAKPKTIAVVLPASGSTEETKSTLETGIPGWNKLTKDEQTELAEIVVKQRGQRQPVKVKITQNRENGPSISIAGDCEAHGVFKLQKAFAAVSMDPVNARANELLRYLGSVGADNTDRYNAALSFIESMEPQNQAEALLLVQMYVTHDAAIRSLTMMGKTDWVPQTQMFGNLAAKLLRASQSQMETLARMRRGGEQVVRHVHVDNRGGQAVITENVLAGGRENEKIANQSHATGAAGLNMIAPKAAMP